MRHRSGAEVPKPRRQGAHLRHRSRRVIALGVLCGGTAFLLSSPLPARAVFQTTATPATTVLTTFTGFPTPQSPATVPDSLAVPQAPYGITLAQNTSNPLSALIDDPINHVVRALTLRNYRPPTGASRRESVFAGDGGYGSGPSGPAAMSQLSGAYATASDPQMLHVYIADTYAHVIRVVSKGQLSTLAGSPGAFGYAGDGGPGLGAKLNSPYGVALSPNGHVLYLADTLNNVIRSVDLSATGDPIQTVAGTGEAAFNGDGPARGSSLNRPRGLAVGAGGSLYIADTGNNRIRVFNPSAKTLTTVAGDGRAAFADGPGSTAEFNQPAGVDYDAVAGGLLVADTSNDVIRRITNPAGSASVSTVVGGAGAAGYSGDCASTCPLATQSRLNSPFGVAALSSGGFLIADTLNFAVRFVDSSSPATAHIWTVAGNGSKSFSGEGAAPTAAELSGVSSISMVSGDRSPLYPVVFADPFNNRVRAIDEGGNIVTLAGTGSAGFSGDGGAPTDAKLDSPFGVAVYFDPSEGENVYVADTFNNRVRRIDIPFNEDSPTTLTTFAGNGTAGWSGDGGSAAAAELSFPVGVAVDDAGNVYIADSYNARIRRVDAIPSPDGSHHIDTVAGNGQLGYLNTNEGGAATSARLFFPYGVEPVGGSGFRIADSFDNRILTVSGAGVVTTIAGTGSEGFSGDGGRATSATLDTPWSIGTDGSGSGMLVTDTMNNRIRAISTGGVISTVVGTGTAGDLGDRAPPKVGELSGPRAIASDASGAMLIADAMSDKLRQVDTAQFSVAGDGDFTDTVPTCNAYPALMNPCPGTFNVANMGNVRLVIDASIANDVSGEFRIVDDRCTSLLPNSSCTIRVTFVGSGAPDTYSGELDVTGGQFSPPIRAALKGVISTTTTTSTPAPPM